MSGVLKTRLCYLAMTFLVVMCYETSALGDEDSAKRLLRSKGLRKVQLTYVLRGEGELRKGIRQIAPLERQLRNAIKKRDTIEKQLDKGEQAIELLLEERRRLNRKLSSGSRTWRRYNRLVGQINDVTDQINILRARSKSSRAIDEADGEIGAARQAYSDHIASLRRKIVETQKAYKVLAKDKAVEAALAELGEILDKNLSLGPSRSFEANLKRIGKLELIVASAVIDLRKEGNVLWVDTVVNGKHNLPFVFDTGASYVTIPPDMANQIGLSPQPGDRSISLTIADGSSVRATLMKLDSLKVGEFEIEDVVCAVMPIEMADAPPLLGGSFLQHFTYSIDPQQGILTLTGNSSAGP